jgi:hypothetical protein
MSEARVEARTARAFCCLVLHFGNLPTDCLQAPQREKPRYQLDNAASSYYLGWLMGLEPTTTGITILSLIYSNLLIFVENLLIINNLRLTKRNQQQF